MKMSEIKQALGEQTKEQTNVPFVEITKEQWEQIKPNVILSSYGADATFYPSVEALMASKKIVTLNGSPIRAIGGRIQSDIRERLKNNTVLKLPNGQFAVASKTLLGKAGFGMGLSTKVQKMPEGL